MFAGRHTAGAAGFGGPLTYNGDLEFTGDEATGTVTFSLSGLTFGAGDLLIAAMVCEENSLEVEAGWTAITTKSIAITSIVAHKIASGSETDMSFSSTATTPEIKKHIAWIGSFSNASLVTSDEDFDISGDADPPSLSLLADDYSLVTGHLDRVDAQTAPTGYSFLSNQQFSPVSLGIASRLVPSDGTYDPAAFSAAGSGAWLATHMAIRNA